MSSLHLLLGQILIIVVGGFLIALPIVFGIVVYKMRSKDED